jgi:hypothetical protein
MVTPALRRRTNMRVSSAWRNYPFQGGPDLLQ